MTKVRVVKNTEQPETKEILAEAILRVGDAVKKLERNGVNKAAVIVLLHDATKISKGDIRTILDALPRLHGWYCRP